MTMTRTTATWLDLAAAPRWGGSDPELKLHPISAGCGECFVLSLSGRMVCNGEGKLTVFRSREAVVRFLTLLELDEPKPGEHAGNVPPDPCGQHCLRLCGSSLCACNLDADDEVPTPRRARYRESVPARSVKFSKDAIF